MASAGSSLSQVDDAFSEISETDRVELRTHLRATTALRSTVTLEEVGRELGLTRERVRQIERKALDKLRRRLGELLDRDPVDIEDGWIAAVMRYGAEAPVHPSQWPKDDGKA